MNDDRVISVYVRMGDAESQRLITFKPPPGIPQMDLLKQGIALDGNQAMIVVGPYPGYSPDSGALTTLYGGALNRDATSLSAALAKEELALAKLLAASGRKVEFK